MSQFKSRESQNNVLSSSNKLKINFHNFHSSHLRLSTVLFCVTIVFDEVKTKGLVYSHETDHCLPKTTRSKKRKTARSLCLLCLLQRHEK